MAADLKNSVSIKVLYDKEKNQVVCAEAGSDFIDVLFSFLTLPVGTVARLIHKQKSYDSTQIGIMNLYQSVKDFSSDNFSTDPCKDMLMYPKSPLQTICKDLKVKYDDTPTQYFLCADVACRSANLSYYKNVKCWCGKSLDREVSECSSSPTASGQGIEVEGIAPQKEKVEVFVKRTTTFFITDDMKVICGTTRTLLELLSDHGINNLNDIEEKVFKLGPEEIVNLVGHTLVSKTALTDLFFPIHKLNSERTASKERDHQLKSNDKSVKAKDKSVEIKIFARKSNKKPLYAEAMEDFVELLFSFLTFPLTDVCMCLRGDPSLECLNNLHKSVHGLDDKWFIKKRSKRYFETPLSKNILLNPGIAQHFNCSSETIRFFYVNDSEIDSMVVNKDGNVRPENFPYDRDDVLLRVTNPKETKKKPDLGFVKRQGLFIISDNFLVKSCEDITSNISFLKGLDVPIDDIEEHTIKIGRLEAMSILKASLTTNSAFALILELMSKKRKRDDSEIILD